jgi:hypothetical protein
MTNPPWPGPGWSGAGLLMPQHRKSAAKHSAIIANPVFLMPTISLMAVYRLSIMLLLRHCPLDYIIAPCKLTLIRKRAITKHLLLKTSRGSDAIRGKKSPETLIFTRIQGFNYGGALLPTLEHFV